MYSHHVQQTTVYLLAGVKAIRPCCMYAHIAATPAGPQPAALHIKHRLVMGCLSLICGRAFPAHDVADINDHSHVDSMVVTDTGNDTYICTSVLSIFMLRFICDRLCFWRHILGLQIYPLQLADCIRQGST